jgi:HSP20 family protein
MEDKMANWDLFQEVDMLRREMDQVFRGLGRSNSTAFLPGISAGGYPQINLSEDEKNYYIEALVPGIDADAIDLNVMQRNLSLSGERKESEDKDYTWHRHERGAGKFMRTIDLAVNIDTTRVNAECKNGVLHITLTKADIEKPKRISLHAS